MTHPASTNSTRPTNPPVPFDPELALALAPLRDAIPTFGSADEIPAARAVMASFATGRTLVEDAVARGAIQVTEQTIPGPNGGPDVSLVILRPAAAKEVVPVLYYTHGGGMVVGDAWSFRPEYLGWVEDLGIGLVSVDYRLAPESPHPGPVEECYAGLVWTATHAAELGFDPARLIILGESAGGGLAAATTLLARHRGQPELAGQVLLCPMLDDRNETVSAHQQEGRGVWDRQANLTGWTALLGETPGGYGVSPYAAPARAEDLSGLPPTYIDVGSAETFRDEDVLYASRIWAAGGEAELHVFAGGFHGYDGLAPDAAVSRDTHAARLAWLTRLLCRLGS